LCHRFAPWACLYDRRAHTEETLGQVRQVHPRLLEPGGASIPSTAYVAPGDFVARGARPAPVPPVVELDVELTGAGELVRLRRLLGRWAGGHGADGDDADDVMIAVGEAVTNALQHGAPPVRVQAFPDRGVARVRVHNPGSAAVFATAGYHRPNTASGGGIGLWLARQLPDVVTINVGTAGTTVELSFPMTRRP
jgi:anti-sigma regulatory factor (Ser/Thr protein kinase)